MPAFSGACSSSNSGAFFGVVRAGRVAGRGADAAIFLGDQGFVVKFLVRRIAPEFAAHALVQAFGKSFGQAVGQRLEQDGVVVVVLLLELARRFASMPMPAVTANAPM